MPADLITVTGPDAAQTRTAAGTTARDALGQMGAIRGQVLAARIDGVTRDLETVLDDGAAVEPVPADSDEGREVLRHSVAHIMAQAVTDLYPGTKFAIGPPITDGFYYDFDVEQPFTPDDLERIEDRMHEIIRENQAFRRRELSRDEALELFADQPYKREIIERATGSEGITGDEAADVDPNASNVISVYDNVRPDGTVWPDLCRGPHIPTTKWVPAFKLQRVAGAYWRGDEKRPMLQRIYGTAWESRKALAAHLERIEQARERDHRKLGRELDLMSFPEELGAGLAVWHPRGGIIRQEMEDYIRAEVRRRGYQPVYTPHLTKGQLFETSGHLGFYAEGMYPPMELDAASEGKGVDYYPKPMNCPFHVLIYKSQQRSYRELPLRLAELGTVYRYERSGVVHGLMRARGFTQDDSHIFCTAGQVVDEVLGCLEFALDVYRDFGFDQGPSRVALSTRPPKAETVGTDEEWAHAEDALRQALDRSGLDYVVDEGQGAFYGPKIDLQVTDAIGRAWQLTTVQVDFNHPQRFDLEYTPAEGAAERPYMVHRALYGSLDRFFGILLEHYAGAFPTWLAPVQAVVVPIADRHEEYGRSVADALASRGLRVEVDDSADTMGAKIRKHQMAKVPYQLIVGDSEADEGTVAVRPRVGEQRKGVALGKFADELATEVASRGRDMEPVQPDSIDALQRLWTPWRMAYIKGEGKDLHGCPFCVLPAGDDDAAALILKRGEHAYTILNAYPYNPGHLMAVPYRHVSRLDELTAAELHEMADLCQRAVGILRSEVGAGAFNIGINVGAVAGAGIADHIHQHVVPRWGGDTNFMPVVGQTRVLPELLEETYRRLAPAFAADS